MDQRTTDKDLRRWPSYKSISKEVDMKISTAVILVGCGVAAYVATPKSVKDAGKRILASYGRRAVRKMDEIVVKVESAEKTSR